MLASALVIGAHPDDENPGILVYLTHARKARAAYLSITRGEGGQNLLGPQRGELLGLIRTQELLASRRIDGAEQYFTRAIDFGYSKSAEETLARWGREETLADIVWVIRRFRPDVVVQIFAGTPADGHGHHQASAVLATEAFHAAGDASRFPEQFRWVEPWSAFRLLQGGWEHGKTGAAIEFVAGGVDPVLGASYAEMGRLVRSMHRSQGMDSPDRPVTPGCSLTLLAGDPPSGDIFDGIDTTWNRLPGGAAPGQILEQAARQFDPENPERTAALLQEARPLVAAIRDPWAAVKLRELDQAAALSRGEETLADPGSSSPQPYWLRLPHGRYRYAVEDQELVGLAETPPQAGSDTAEYALSAWTPERVLLFPDDAPRISEVRLQSHAAAVDGEVRLQLPPEWRADPLSSPFRLRSGETSSLSFLIAPPAGDARAELRLSACAGTQEVSGRLYRIAYPDLTPQAVFLPSVSKLVRTSVRTLARQVGYIVGAEDEAPAALRQLGCEVTLLGPGDLASGDLGRYDAIVAGVRAFNVRADLREHRPRLLDYVRAGGAWVVQYNVADSRSKESVANIGPYPLRLGRERVTNERAPITFLAPDHPLLTSPNRISERDFDGWVQERGLYFAAAWDPLYTPLFECADAGEAPQQGATLYTRCGAGVYIFTAFSWFRQLPEGVPGAYRIFANFVSAAKTGR